MPVDAGGETDASIMETEEEEGGGQGSFGGSAAGGLAPPFLPEEKGGGSSSRCGICMPAGAERDAGYDAAEEEDAIDHEVLNDVDPRVASGGDGDVEGDEFEAAGIERGEDGGEQQDGSKLKTAACQDLTSQPCLSLIGIAPVLALTGVSRPVFMSSV